MCSSSLSLRKKRKTKGDGNGDEMSGSAAPIVFAASILLKQRCPQMSALAFRFSLGVLWHGGAKKQGFVRANRWGISVSHNSTLKKLDEMGKNFDSEVKTWKRELEDHHLINEMLDHVDEYLTTQEVQKQEQIPEGFQTINISSLDLSFPTADSSIGCCNENSQSTNSDLANMEDFLDDYKQYSQSESIKALSNAGNCPVSDHLITSGFSEGDLKTFNDFVFDHETVDELNKLDKIDVGILKSHQNSNEPPKYQIIGDNLDMYVKVKHMSSDKQNRSIHWFAMNAIQDRVSSKCPDNATQIKPILEVENSEFLPSPEDNNKLLQDFIPLAARVLVDKVPDFKCFSGTIIKHIPHQFSQEMK
ncbi:uncharacterized protein LOC116295548, partial [Actinia tenebrosa]|uniref:Uncharacterized protein LOC116295548 n=1 Tax=Actinia tenebrosa TaxID=6105 RepID=A0A6P8I351_ACTTE